MTVDRRHRFGSGRRSHYYNNQPTGNGGTIVRDTNPVGHRASTTSGSIDRATGVGSLFKI